MILVRVQQWPPVVILCFNSVVHNSWPTKRQQQARLQAPASGRRTWKEACKSAGRKGKVIRSNRQQKDGAEKLTRMPACEIENTVQFCCRNARWGLVLLCLLQWQGHIQPLKNPPVFCGLNTGWNATTSSPAYLPWSRPLQPLEAGDAFPSARSPCELCGTWAAVCRHLAYSVYK